ncbi:hypothetical protein AVEN_95120-1 [Araneus ventricosus]|uniref:Peptidase A2 domain-containing protein n=1 Tax=Araneus ventricosus TaxID=182803 RepID=A0A4Y2UJK1_ARAVE|nr:hypothetical protein AVEN_95120-1 [Araneus ventricosus]
MPNPDHTKLGECNNYSASVSAVAIKTPAFCSDTPVLWFAQFECFFVYDKITGREFLVDTGSRVRVLPIFGSKIVPSKFVLYAANGTKINTLGTKLITLNLGLKRKFQWPFILASVSKPILGADFPEHYNLLVNMKRKKLLDDTSAVSLEKPISANESMYVATAQGDSPYVKLLLKFSDITMPSLPKPLLHVKHHNTEHHIETRGPPVFDKAR